MMISIYTSEEESKEEEEEADFAVHGAQTILKYNYDEFDLTLPHLTSIFYHTHERINTKKCVEFLYDQSICHVNYHHTHKFDLVGIQQGFRMY